MEKIQMIFIAVSEHDFEDKFDIVKNKKLGLELLMFTSYQNLYDDDKISLIKKMVKDFPIAIHAPYELFNVSNDKIIRSIVMEHVNRTIKVAKIFDAKRIIFHTGFRSFSKSKRYHNDFLHNAVEFFSSLNSDIEIVVENVYENDPLFIKTIADRADVGVCLDVGHAKIYSKYSIERWKGVLNDRIKHVHLQNNFGKYDDHGIEGVIDIVSVAKQFTCDKSLEVFCNPSKISTLVDKLIELKMNNT